MEEQEVKILKMEHYPGKC